MDAGLVGLAGQILIYPMLDDPTVRRATATGARGWTPQDNSFGWRSYLGREPGTGDVSPYAVPARRDDLSGLPPTWIVSAPQTFFTMNVSTTPTGCAQQECPHSSGLFPVASMDSTSSEHELRSCDTFARIN